MDSTSTKWAFLVTPPTLPPKPGRQDALTQTTNMVDNVLLQQMGTKNIPAHGPDETQRWNAGLQEVIKGLKAANVRDAITIAARIADYRREFVKDPTRVIFP